MAQRSLGGGRGSRSANSRFRRLGAVVFGVSVGHPVDVPGEAVVGHCRAVAGPPVLRPGVGTAVDVGDGLVTEGYQVVDRLPRAHRVVGRLGEFAIATAGLPADANGFRRVIVGVEHPYISGGLAMDATGIGFGHNDSFVYQARAFLDEIASRDELPRNASFAEGLHNLHVTEAVVHAAAHPDTAAISGTPTLPSRWGGRAVVRVGARALGRNQA
jgi:hypothetical protein